ncbi:MAG TPA: nitrous oxide reductase family maturation protein NosD [Gemmatimonadales bacterium]|nr:nitrous oxide reductase family maturation protein NosD [Gemmatimonadales bacterium]
MLGLFLALVAQDTLRLPPGVTRGPLVLDRPTVVLGAPGAVLRGEGRGSVIVVNAPHCVVRGLRIEGSGRDLDQDDAGVMIRADSVTLEDLVIRDVLFGVYLYQVRGARLARLDIAGAAAARESSQGNGIEFYYSRDVRVDSATITGVRDGMYFAYSDSVTVSGSAVRGVRFGLHFMFSHDDRFARNTFTDNAAGAVLMNSTGVRVEDNVFAWNGGSRSYGLVLQTATAPVVTGNLLVGNGVGVLFDNVIRGAFRGNLVAANWLGLELFNSSEGTAITGNALAGNTFDATGGGLAGAYTLCEGGRGNYWARAASEGYDLDGDGVLDAPHPAGSPFAALAVARPGLRLFLESPAARTLDWAERSFPVFDAGGVTDGCPLARPPATPALDRLPPAPRGSEGGAGGQRAAGGIALALGAVALAFARRRG